MLVLSRREGEEIILGDRIRVYVARITGRQVHLAIDAPRDVRIRRAEIPALEHPLVWTPTVPALPTKACS